MLEQSEGNLSVEGMRVECEDRGDLMRWYPPQEHWIKLNSDGAAEQATRRAGAGSILRDAGGRWVKGSIRLIRTDSSVLESFGEY